MYLASCDMLGVEIMDLRLVFMIIHLLIYVICVKITEKFMIFIFKRDVG